MNFKSFLYLSGVIIILNSCASVEDLISFNEGPEFSNEPQKIPNLNTILVQPSDILYVQVSHRDPLLAAPYNQGGAQGNTVGNVNRESLQLSGYLVDEDGIVDFPGIGPLKVAGLSITEVRTLVKSEVENYLKDPIVNVRILNFRINVLGEVMSPGTFNIPNDRITVIEALALAGDLTVFGRRDSILLTREVNGVREHGYLDLNSTEIFKSKYYYLQQNDVLYIQPLPTKVTQVRDPATRVLPWVSALTSTAAFILSVILAGR